MNQFDRFGLPVGTTTGNPERKAHLERLQRVRDGHSQLTHQDWGSLVLSIPELDYYVLTNRYPDLASPDAEIKLKAWKKFLASPESEIYRVRRNDGKRAPSNKIIVK